MITSTVEYDSRDTYYFARYGDKVELRKALSQGNNSLNWYKDCDGMTACHWAVRNGHKECMMMILDSGFDINTADDHGNTIVHFSAYNGNMDFIHFLIERNIDFNVKNKEGNTILHEASARCRNNVFAKLLDLDLDSDFDDEYLDKESDRELDIDINIKNNNGDTALMIAVRFKNATIVKMLLHQEDIDKNSKNKEGKSAFDIAWENNILYGHTRKPYSGCITMDIIDYLMCQNVEIDTNMLLDTNIDLNIRNKNGETVIHLGTKYNYVNFVKKLLEKDIDINCVDYELNSIAHYAAKYGHEDLMDLLLGTNIDLNIKNYDGSTALNLAVRRSSKAIVEMLVFTEKVDLNIKNNAGNTPLMEAVMYNRESMVKTLLDTGKLDVTTRNNDNETLIYVAWYRGRLTILEMLLQQTDIDINTCNFFSSFGYPYYSLLHRAAQRGDKSAVEIILLHRGIDVNIDDDIDQYEPLGDAYGNPTVDCRYLIFAETENRRKKALFDIFINHHIEYQPYINTIYSRCYPTGSVRQAKPSVGWIKAEDIRDKYYFDEVFFYLHLHIANLYFTKELGGRSSMNCSSSTHNLANSSNKTSALMAILTDRLLVMLKPKHDLSIDVPWVLKLDGDDNSDDNDDYDVDDNEDDDDDDNEDDDDDDGCIVS